MFNRREFLKNVAAAGAGASLAGCASTTTPPASDRIVTENLRPGTRE